MLLTSNGAAGYDELRGMYEQVREAQALGMEFTGGITFEHCPRCGGRAERIGGLTYRSILFPTFHCVPCALGFAQIEHAEVRPDVH
jgi:hypothetical protein